MAEPSTVRIDLRAVFAIAALGIVVLVIIFVQLCGRESGQPSVQSSPPPVDNPTEPPVATDTPGPSPTLGPPTETPAPEPGGDERDVTREQDLADIEQALADYKDDKGDYPDTGGNIQSLCVFQDTDAGCDLKDFLDPLPMDPLGEPVSENGYWYASDGKEFTVYAQRESNEIPACAEHPDHLSHFASVLCVQSP
ncbi:MAG: type II secretion system protein GspG [Dehalococcoidia bacterium]